MLCPTVKIRSDNEDGYVVINESDFDDSKHTLWAPEDPEAKSQAEEAQKLADEAEAQRLKAEADAEAKRLADEAKRLASQPVKKAK